MSISILPTKSLSISGTSLLAVTLLALNGEEGLTLPHAAQILGVSQQNIHQICERNGLIISTLSLENAQTLRTAGVIPMRGRSPGFIPRSTMKELVRLVGTPESQALYDQLWDVAEAVQEGNLTKAQEMVGVVSQPPLISIETLENAHTQLGQALALAKRLQAERDEAVRTKALIGSRREATAMASAATAYRKLRVVEAKLNLQEMDTSDHKSLLAWEKETGLSLLQPHERRASVIKMLKDISKEKNLPIIKIKDDRWGEVNGYHKDAIAALSKVLPD